MRCGSSLPNVNPVRRPWRFPRLILHAIAVLGVKVKRASRGAPRTLTPPLGDGVRAIKTFC
jgi:hypothetical protein